MRIVRSGEVPEEPVAPGLFMGRPSRRDLGPVEIGDGGALLVYFLPGAGTHWHAHPNGQMLSVTQGRGRVATRDGRVEELDAGDPVVAPPGKQPRHGATEDEAVVHLALSFGETACEPVEDPR